MAYRKREYPRVVGREIHYTFTSPLYGTTVGIRPEYLKEAIRIGLPFRIFIKGIGSAIIDAVDALENGERFTTGYLYKAMPMVLVRVKVPIEVKEKVYQLKKEQKKVVKTKKWPEKEVQLSLFDNLKKK